MRFYTPFRRRCHSPGVAAQDGRLRVKSSHSGSDDQSPEMATSSKRTAMVDGHGGGTAAGGDGWMPRGGVNGDAASKIVPDARSASPTYWTAATVFERTRAADAVQEKVKRRVCFKLLREKSVWPEWSLLGAQLFSCTRMCCKT